MADTVASAVSKSFADLTVALEDAAVIAAFGQGIKDLKDARRQLRQLKAAIARVERHLTRLEVTLG